MATICNSQVLGISVTGPGSAGSVCVFSQLDYLEVDCSAGQLDMAQPWQIQWQLA